MVTAVGPGEGTFGKDLTPLAKRDPTQEVAKPCFIELTKILTSKIPSSGIPAPYDYTDPVTNTQYTVRFVKETRNPATGTSTFELLHNHRKIFDPILSELDKPKKGELFHYTFKQNTGEVFVEKSKDQYEAVEKKEVREAFDQTFNKSTTPFRTTRISQGTYHGFIERKTTRVQPAQIAPPKPPKAPDPIQQPAKREITAPSSEALEKFLSEKPVGLPNLGNTCYISVGLQALMVVPEFLKKLFNPPKPEIRQAEIDSWPAERRGKFIAEKEAEFQTKAKVRESLAELVMAQMTKADPKTIEEKIRNFKQAAFASGLHPELKPKSFTKELDAASIVELVMDCLEMRHWYQKQCTVDLEGKGVITRPMHRPVAESLVKLSLPRGASEHDAQELFQSCYVETEAEDKDPLKLEAAKWGLESDTSVPSWRERVGIKDKPSRFLGLQFIRFDKKLTPFKIFGVSFGSRITTVKIDDQIKFPDDNILDLSLAFDEPPGTVKRELTSFIVHTGTIDGGHYIAYTKKGDQWYECNDGTIRLISQDEMKKQKKNAYIAFLSDCPSMNLSSIA